MQNSSRPNRAGTTACDTFSETARRAIDDLRREQPELEVDNRMNLRGWRRRALRVARDRVHDLSDETVADRLTRLRRAAIPHHAAQKFQVG